MKLQFDRGVLDLERRNQWIEAADRLYSQWQRSPGNKNCLLCAGAEIWFLICYYDQPPLNETIDYDSFDLAGSMEKLQELTKEGFARYPYDPDFLALFGCLMKVQPFWFVSGQNRDVLSIEKKGLEMVREAYRLSPDDPDIDAIYRHWYPLDGEAPGPLFDWGDGDVSGYFTAVFGK